jgi:hypothetical protein
LYYITRLNDYFSFKDVIRNFVVHHQDFFVFVYPLFTQLAANGSRCDYGIYLGAGPDNYDNIKNIAHLAAGLKMYLNETFTTLRLDDLTQWMKVRNHGDRSQLDFLDAHRPPAPCLKNSRSSTG